MNLLSVAAGRPAPLAATFLLAGLLLPVAASQAAPSFIYSSPRPDATLVSPGTTITVRYPQPVDPAALSPAAFDVRGTESGARAGDVTLAGDGRTVIFTPHAPFARGERVTAVIGGLQTAGGERLAGGDLAFTVAARPAAFDPAAPPTALRPLLESAAATRPVLVARTELTETAVYYSWNGATAVDAWRLYAGPAPGDLDPVDVQPRAGFETRSAVADPDLCFFRVEALDAGGAVLESSAVTIAERCVAGRAFLPAVPASGP